MNIPVLNKRSTGYPRAVVQLLGSMNFAIMLLVILAIASVIGTILQQNQPYQDYIVKFGPYWHQVFQTLGLYDVYSSAWFVTILAFLVGTTGYCVYRHAPQMLRNLRRFNVDMRERALLTMPEHGQWSCLREPADLQGPVERYLHNRGYRTRSKETAEERVIAARKGGANRIGYILTHLAIVVICIGGLLDGNLPLKLKRLTGQVEVETRDLKVANIPAASRLPADNPSFRSGVSIPEGARVDYAFINIAGGYLLQKLPFSIHVKDFRIEHYNSGQPKSFASDVVIRDKESRQTLESTIKVNHPLFYNGYAIYQSSFADGGTGLELQLQNILGRRESRSLQGIINSEAEVRTPEGSMRIEFDDFRLFNIFESGEGSREFVDYGPSFTYKLRREDGTAHEYVNYMNPVPVDDRYYYLSGVRSSVAEEFRYLYIPVDDEHSAERFFRFQALLYDEDRSNSIINESVASSLQSMQGMDAAFEENVRKAMQRVLSLFRQGGFAAISDYANDRLKEADREPGAQAYMQLLQSGLLQLYIKVLEEEGVNIQNPDAAQGAFFDDALSALNAMHFYESPFYLQLQDYEHRQATGLQITRTPGKKFVYTGFVMLITGVFFLFYIHQQKLWVILRNNGHNTGLTIAGTRSRHTRDFAREFSRTVADLQAITTDRGDGKRGQA